MVNRGMDVQYEIWEEKCRSGAWQRYGAQPFPLQQSQVQLPSITVSASTVMSLAVTAPDCPPPPISTCANGTVSVSCEIEGDDDNDDTEMANVSIGVYCDHRESSYTGCTEAETGSNTEVRSVQQILTTESQLNGTLNSFGEVGISGVEMNCISSSCVLQSAAATNSDSSSSSEDDEPIELSVSCDPATYSNVRIDDSVIRCLLTQPCHPPDTFTFPTTNGRHCSRKMFFRTLPDNNTQPRKWLSYSVSRDRLYCLHCMLFGGPVTADSVVWVKHGYNNWGSLIRDLMRHEGSLAHRTAESGRLAWLFGRRIESDLASQRIALVEVNRHATSVAIKAINWLAGEMVAIRGHNSVEGKFMSLYRLLSDFDPAAKAYLDRLDQIRSNDVKRKPGVNVLSPRNVRRWLTVMKSKILTVIVDRMKQVGVCSIINDGTQDLSKLEASCLLIRYLEEDKGGRYRPVERLVGIFTTGSTSGETLCNKVVKHLNEINVPIAHVTGQSYDGAGNMSGRYKGLQALIQQIQPKALYIWCSAHRLNLVVESVVCCCTAIRNALGILQELYNFFGSHRRHAVLIKLQSDSRYKKPLNASQTQQGHGGVLRMPALH